MLLFNSFYFCLNLFNHYYYKGMFKITHNKHIYLVLILQLNMHVLLYLLYIFDLYLTLQLNVTKLNYL